MKKDKHKTEVKFYFEQDETESNVFAVFTKDFRISADKKKLFNSYAPIGQHSEACQEYINNCEIAPIDKCQDLIKELENIGYNLEILNA